MHTPRKRFGQHFLCDQMIISRIVAAINPRQLDHLVEIGPGLGAITVPVLDRAKQLIAIELDRDVIAELKTRVLNHGELIVHNQDALTFDFAKLKTDERKLRIFGNLPYNISTPLLFHLLTFTSIVSDMVFMLQKEVAERLAADVGSEHYGRLSVMLQYHCDVDLLFDVPPNAFFPPPQVYSSIVKLTPSSRYAANDYHLFEKIVKLAFNQRRKTLRNSLKNIIDDTIWQQLAIRSDLRAENLSVQQFIDISNALLEKISVR